MDRGFDWGGRARKERRGALCYALLRFYDRIRPASVVPLGGRIKETLTFWVRRFTGLQSMTPTRCDPYQPTNFQPPLIYYTKRK